MGAAGGFGRDATRVFVHGSGTRRFRQGRRAGLRLIRWELRGRSGRQRLHDRGGRRDRQQLGCGCRRSGRQRLRRGWRRRGSDLFGCAQRRARREAALGAGATALGFGATGAVGALACPTPLPLLFAGPPMSVLGKLSACSAAAATVPGAGSCARSRAARGSAAWRPRPARASRSSCPPGHRG